MYTPVSVGIILLEVARLVFVIIVSNALNYEVIGTDYILTVLKADLVINLDVLLCI